MTKDIFYFFIGCKKNNNLLKWILQNYQLEIPVNEELIFGPTNKLSYIITAYTKYNIYKSRQYKHDMDYINKQEAAKSIREHLQTDNKLFKFNIGLEPYESFVRNT